MATRSATAMIIWQLFICLLTTMTVYMYEISDYYYPNENRWESAQEDPDFVMFRKTYTECHRLPKPSFCIGLKGKYQNLKMCDFNEPGNNENCFAIAKFDPFYGQFSAEPDLAVLVVVDGSHSAVSVQLHSPYLQRAAREFYCNHRPDPRENMTFPSRLGRFSWIQNFYGTPAKYYCTWKWTHKINATTWITKSNTVTLGIYDKTTLKSNLVMSSWPISKTAKHQSESEPGFAILRKTYAECRQKHQRSFCIGLKGEVQNLRKCEFDTPGNDENCFAIAKFDAHFGHFKAEPDLMTLVVVQGNQPAVSVQLFGPKSTSSDREFYCNRRPNPRTDMTFPVKAGTLSLRQNFYSTPDGYYCKWNWTHDFDVKSWITKSIEVRAGIYDMNTLKSNLVRSRWPISQMIQYKPGPDILSETYIDCGRQWPQRPFCIGLKGETEKLKNCEFNTIGNDENCFAIVKFEPIRGVFRAEPDMTVLVVVKAGHSAVAARLFSADSRIADREFYCDSGSRQNVPVPLKLGTFLWSKNVDVTPSEFYCTWKWTHILNQTSWITKTKEVKLGIYDRDILKSSVVSSSWPIAEQEPVIATFRKTYTECRRQIPKQTFCIGLKGQTENLKKCEFDTPENDENCYAIAKFDAHYEKFRTEPNMTVLVVVKAGHSAVAARLFSADSRIADREFYCESDPRKNVHIPMRLGTFLWWKNVDVTRNEYYCTWNWSHVLDQTSWITKTKEVKLGIYDKRTLISSLVSLSWPFSEHEPGLTMLHETYTECRQLKSFCIGLKGQIQNLKKCDFSTPGNDEHCFAIAKFDVHYSNLWKEPDLVALVVVKGNQPAVSAQLFGPISGTADREFYCNYRPEPRVNMTFPVKSGPLLLQQNFYGTPGEHYCKWNWTHDSDVTSWITTSNRITLGLYDNTILKSNLVTSKWPLSGLGQKEPDRELFRKTYEECRRLQNPSFCVGLKGEVQSLSNCLFNEPGNEENCFAIIRFDPRYGKLTAEPDLMVLVVVEGNYSGISAQLLLPNSNKHETEFYCDHRFGPSAKMAFPAKTSIFSWLKEYHGTLNEYYCTWNWTHISNETSWITKSEEVSVGLYDNGALTSSLVIWKWPLLKSTQRSIPVTTSLPIFYDESTNEPEPDWIESNEVTLGMLIDKQASPTTTTQEPTESANTSTTRCKSGTVSWNAPNLICVFVLLLISLYF